MNAAGGVHCGIEDYARYARENLRGLKGRSALLGADGFRAIHSVRATASIGDLYGPGLHALTAAYGAGIARQTTSIGYGWVIALTPDGPLSAGDGSGGTFFARIALWPSLDAAFVTATSAGSGAPAASEAIRAVTGLDWA